MTRYDTSGNVETEVEDISSFTIASTGGTITDAQFVRFLAKADAQLTADDPGSLLAQAQANEAIALLICHYIARKQGKSGKVSESGIGRYGYSRRGSAGLTSWLDDYDDLLQRVKDAPVDLTSDTYSQGYTRDDATMNGLKLDQSTAYDLDDEVRTE
jgi:hypothetical protein